MYMDDTPLLEHALSLLDQNCSIRYTSHHFGENAYAFGVRKGSWIKVRDLRFLIEHYFLINMMYLFYLCIYRWSNFVVSLEFPILTFDCGYAFDSMHYSAIEEHLRFQCNT